MLVLTRRVEQVVTIGDPKSPTPPIEIQVVEVRGDQVRIGIKAPPEIKVHRKEVWLQIMRESG